MRLNMRSMVASDLRSSLLNTVWNRLNDATALGPQASAASVNSCCTAATWMAEISAALAQADDTARACAADMAIILRAATQPLNFIPFIETLFDCPSHATLTSSPLARQASGKEELSS